ncbi:MAG: hypothetical protein JJ863_19345 [Deltaproteobacteria bacterium]|nr:hypothetical protein [Deltaproteobacteria bacterium]
MSEACDDAALTAAAIPAPAPERSRGWRWLEKRPWLKRILKAMVVMLVVAVALVVVLFLRVRGEIHAALGPLGAQLDQAGLLDELLQQDQPISGDDRVLVINGQRLHLETDTVDKTVADALNAFLESCPTGNQLGQPVMDEDRGYAICAHPPEGEDSSLTDRLEAFRETSDIGQLGRLEYAYATSFGDGGKTSILRLASSDRFEIDELMPSDGHDVQGSDPHDFPRPPDGPRVLHSFEEGLPYALYVYGRSQRTPAELTQWYRNEVDREIWVELDLQAEAERRGVDVDVEGSLVFARRGEPTRFVMVELEEQEENERRPGRTMVAIAEAR